MELVYIFPLIIVSVYSTRMGIAFSIVGISLLLGTPIEGALLRMRVGEDGFLWFKSIIFCGVSLSLVF